MGTTMKVSAAVLVAAAGVYFLASESQIESPSLEPPERVAVDPPRPAPELADPANLSEAEEPSATDAERRSLVPQEQPVDEAAAAHSEVLRVVLEGVSEEYARRATITVAGGEDGHRRHGGIQDSWPVYGSTIRSA